MEICRSGSQKSDPLPQTPSKEHENCLELAMDVFSVSLIQLVMYVVVLIYLSFRLRLQRSAGAIPVTSQRTKLMVTNFWRMGRE